MSSFKLASPRQAEDCLARAFLDDGPVEILVREEKAFLADQWLEMGSLQLFCLDRKDADDLKCAVRFGSFEWHTPSETDTAARLKILLGIDKLPEPKKKTAEEKLPGILQAIAGVSLRTGLSWPRFDPMMISQMPFRRPVTIVADTSGVIQGALAFVADYLHPTARLKIPAVLHMEVINQTDRFMKTWRSSSVRGEMLLSEHLRSQPVQRALVQLELRDDTEVERNPLFGDPLRNAFKEDRDQDFKDLNLSLPLKSYVDRMILEVGRTHQSHASPGHEVYLLTADQGLAKMALAEGLRPLYFKAMKSSQLFGRTLTGTLLHPFSGKRVSRGLPNLLWELATAFGRVKLRRGEVDLVEIASIGSDLGWSSYHSVEDLLWLRSDGVPEWPPKPVAPPIANIDDLFLGDAPAAGVDAPPDLPAQDTSVASQVVDRLTNHPAPKAAERSGAAKPSARSRATSGKLAPTNKAGVPFHRFTANGIVQLVDRLADQQTLPEKDVGRIVGVGSPVGLSDYRRFLQSGELIEVSGDEWRATDALTELATTQRDRDIMGMRRILEQTPSFGRFVELVAAAPTGAPVSLEIPPRVLFSYVGLGEVTGVCATIPDEGLFGTLAVPTVAEFAALALARFEQLDPLDGWVSVGEWLERLVRQDAIHPVMARDLLQEANAANLIERFTEGSTTDTRQDDHTLKILQAGGGKVGVETVHLYRGDFLIPGKSSSSLRLQEPS